MLKKLSMILLAVSLLQAEQETLSVNIDNAINELERQVEIVSNLEMITNDYRVSLLSLSNERYYESMMHMADIKLAKMNGSRRGLWAGIGVCAAFIAVAIGVKYWLEK